VPRSRLPQPDPVRARDAQDRSPSPASAVKPDLLISGGPIWTGRRTVEAVGVAAGRVVAAGPRDEAEPALRRGWREIDLEGRRAIPGLIDSHVHVLRAGLTWTDIARWDDIASLEAGLERIRQAAESRP